MHADLAFCCWSLFKMPPYAYKSVWLSHGEKAGLVCEPISPNVDAHPSTGVRLHMAASALLCPTLGGGGGNTRSPVVG